MTDVEIRLHLCGYCIETAAKRRYDEIVRTLLGELEPDEEERLERELELLLEFLKKAEFPELRKAGFDGREEMRVSVRKVGNDFVVRRVE